MMTDCKDCRLAPKVALAATAGATTGTSGGRPPVGLKDEIRVHKTTQSSAPAACSLSYNVYQTSEQYASSELTTTPYETVGLTSTLYTSESTELIHLNAGARGIVLQKAIVESSNHGESLPFSAGGSGLRFRSATVDFGKVGEEQVGFSAGAGSIILSDVIRRHEQEEPEQISFSASAGRITHRQVLIAYTDKEESTAFSASATRIRLHEY